MVPGQKFQVLSRVPGSICPGIGLITRYSLLVRLGVSVQRMAESMDEGITALESADEEGAEYLDKHDKKSVGEYDDGREVAVGQETATANAFDALLQAAEGAADRIAKTTAAANSIGSSVESSHSLSSSQPGRPLDGVIGAKVSRGDWRASCEQQQWFGEDKNLAEQLLAAQDVDKSRPNKKDKKVWPAASRVVLHNEHLAQSADTRAWVLKLQKQQAITGTQLARRAGDAIVPWTIATDAAGPDLGEGSVTISSYQTLTPRPKGPDCESALYLDMGRKEINNKCNL